VVGSRFQQGDDSIVVLGKLREIIRPAEAEPEKVADTEPVIAAPISGTPSEPSSEKRVVTVDVSSTKAADAGPRRVRIKAKAAPTTNEPST
jgi:hypothetical protein